MDANTAQTLISWMLDGNSDTIRHAFNVAWQEGTFGLWWDFWAVVIPSITYLYTQSERSTLVATLLILTLGYMYSMLSVSFVPLSLAAVLLVAKTIWAVVAQAKR